jgi:hypothetical protein
MSKKNENSAEFRTYVFKDPGRRFRARVAAGKKSKKIAKRALRTALVARDLADPDTPLDLSLMAETDTYHEYRLRTALLASGVCPLEVGDHVMIVENPGYRYHQFAPGTVVQVTRAPYRTVSSGARERIRASGMSASSSWVENWIYVDHVTRTDRPLTL